ncbi:ARIP4-like protein [Mya arenaria]|uniref:ARIP4-like protein n=1 Tax=Mya arenaria TaxID=6604 RepID=A0ABY7FY82_MYAAR|nr:ARIP4-like protein [Mya arenaria]
MEGAKSAVVAPSFGDNQSSQFEGMDADFSDEQFEDFTMDSEYSKNEAFKNKKSVGAASSVESYQSYTDTGQKSARQKMETPSWDQIKFGAIGMNAAENKTASVKPDYEQGAEAIAGETPDENFEDFGAEGFDYEGYDDGYDDNMINNDYISPEKANIGSALPVPQQQIYSQNSRQALDFEMNVNRKENGNTVVKPYEHDIADDREAISNELTDIGDEFGEVLNEVDEQIRDTDDQIKESVDEFADDEEGEENDNDEDYEEEDEDDEDLDSDAEYTEDDGEDEDINEALNSLGNLAADMDMEVEGMAGETGEGEAGPSEPLQDPSGDGEAPKEKKRRKRKKKGDHAEGDGEGGKQKKKRKRKGEKGEGGEKKKGDNHARKNIRKILTESNLDKETLDAQNAELDRQRRLQELKRQQLAALLQTEREPKKEKDTAEEEAEKTADHVMSKVEIKEEPIDDFIKPRKEGVIDISSGEDDDDVVMVRDEDEDEGEDASDEDFAEAEDVNNSGSHINDQYNVPDEHGRVLVNVGHPTSDPDIYLSPLVAKCIKPHQIGGVRFLYDNLVECINRFKTSSGFGCILAHSMGLGKTIQMVGEWYKTGGVLLLGYEMYRLLSSKKVHLQKSKGKKKVGSDVIDVEAEDRDKNLRRIVLTGYPLQNNLIEYWCMVDFVRPNFLGNKTEFCNMFERPIMNGQCVDSTPQDMRLMRYRAHVLHSLLEGFVQRRGHTVLQAALPPKEEYVFKIRMSPIQQKLYDKFMESVTDSESNGWVNNNPLKAFSVCCKIWNHPDILYNCMKKSLDDNDLDIETGEPKKKGGRAGGKGKKETPPATPNPLTPMVASPASDTTGSFGSQGTPGAVAGPSTPVAPLGPTVPAPGVPTVANMVGPMPLPNFGRSSEPTITYDWANEIFKDYVPGMLENGGKMIILFNLISESLQMGDKILVFRAGSLGINLVAANRVVVVDASWNPCHDCQAICRVYRFGQIYDRQVNKQGMADRVVDELNPQNQFKKEHVDKLMVHENKEFDQVDFSDLSEYASDTCLCNMLHNQGHWLTSKPFTHESLLIDRKELKLTMKEKRLAKQSYVMEKQIVLPGTNTTTEAGTSEPKKIPAGQQVLVIRTPKGVYIRTPDGKIFAVRSKPQPNSNSPLDTLANTGSNLSTGGVTIVRPTMTTTVSAQSSGKTTTGVTVIRPNIRPSLGTTTKPLTIIRQGPGQVRTIIPVTINRTGSGTSTVTVKPSPTSATQIATIAAQSQKVSSALQSAAKIRIVAPNTNTSSATGGMAKVSSLTTLQNLASGDKKIISKSPAFSGGTTVIKNVQPKVQNAIQNVNVNAKTIATPYESANVIANKQAASHDKPEPMEVKPATAELKPKVNEVKPESELKQLVQKSEYADSKPKMETQQSTDAAWNLPPIDMKALKLPQQFNKTPTAAVKAKAEKGQRKSSAKSKAKDMNKGSKGGKPPSGTEMPGMKRVGTPKFSLSNSPSDSSMSGTQSPDVQNEHFGQMVPPQSNLAHQGILPMRPSEIDLHQMKLSGSSASLASMGDGSNFGGDGHCGQNLWSHGMQNNQSMSQFSGGNQFQSNTVPPMNTESMNQSNLPSNNSNSNAGFFNPGLPDNSHTVSSQNKNQMLPQGQGPVNQPMMQNQGQGFSNNQNIYGGFGGPAYIDNQRMNMNNSNLPGLGHQSMNIGNSSMSSGARISNTISGISNASMNSGIGNSGMSSGTAMSQADQNSATPHSQNMGDFTMSGIHNNSSFLSELTETDENFLSALDENSQGSSGESSDQGNPSVNIDADSSSTPIMANNITGGQLQQQQGQMNFDMFSQQNQGFYPNFGNNQFNRNSNFGNQPNMNMSQQGNFPGGSMYPMGGMMQPGMFPYPTFAPYPYPPMMAPMPYYPMPFQPQYGNQAGMGHPTGNIPQGTQMGQNAGSSTVGMPVGNQTDSNYQPGMGN